jgi:hypothetical protein
MELKKARASQMVQMKPLDSWMAIHSVVETVITLVKLRLLVLLTVYW